jgi:hypothetical protein
MIEILSAIGLIAVIAAICSALEQRHYNAGEWAIRNQARALETIKAEYEVAERARQKQWHARAHTDALDKAWEALENGDVEMVDSWLEYSRELERWL